MIIPSIIIYYTQLMATDLNLMPKLYHIIAYYSQQPMAVNR